MNKVGKIRVFEGGGGAGFGAGEGAISVLGLVLARAP